MRVLVLAEYYPRAHDPALGIWAHRQALAARAAGADIRVLVLHRPIPPLAAVRALDRSSLLREARQPRVARIDGLEVTYVNYLSPPRPWSYGSWGAWAAPALARALRRVRAGFPFELVHAHYAVPAGDALRRAAPRTPLIVSVHGGDVHGVQARRAGAGAVRRTLAHARLVLANSTGTAGRCEALGARRTRVVHLGTDLPPCAPRPPAPGEPPLIVSVGNLVARKRHADVIAAVARLRERHPRLRYVIVGDGPERERLRAQANSLGLRDVVELCGRLAHHDAVRWARAATVFALPSVDEAFGVAYIEAMAGGVPVIACRGEDGPEEIAASGGGILLVERGDVPGLAARIDLVLADRDGRDALARAARANVERHFTWELCGSRTMAAYSEATTGV